jgi:AlwI restriction endonuclease
VPQWQFEHFKTFVSYDIMQPAAACLVVFEGENTDGSNPQMNKLSRMLIERTNHPSWLADRNTGSLNIDTEGSVFRNKARLFSSLMIVVPPELLRLNNLEKVIKLTEFGKALGLGYVSERQYYEFLIKNFQYPHPAYLQDYEDWVNEDANIRPFIFILKVLVDLYENFGEQQSFLTSNEIFHFLQHETTDSNIESVVDKLIKNREDPQTFSKVDTRKIEEILSFLAKSGHIFIKENTVDMYYLNLLEKHSYEKSYYWEKRRAGGAGTGQRKYTENKLEQIKNLWGS